MSFNLWGNLFLCVNPIHIEHANTLPDSITCFCFQPPPASVYDVAYPNTSEKVDIQDASNVETAPSEPSEEFKVNVTNLGLVHTYRMLQTIIHTRVFVYICTCINICA